MNLRFISNAVVLTLAYLIVEGLLLSGGSFHSHAAASILSIDEKDVTSLHRPRLFYYTLLHQLIVSENSGSNRGYSNDLVAIVDVGDANGIEFLEWLLLFEKQVYLFAYEPNVTSYMSTTSAINEIDHATKSILINKYPGYHMVDAVDVLDSVVRFCYHLMASDKMPADCSIINSYSVSHMYSAVGNICPAILNFKSTRGLLDIAGELMLDALLGSMRTILSCQPIIFIEDVTAASSPAVMNTLRNVFGYEYVYWQVNIQVTNAATMDRKETLIVSLLAFSKASIKDSLTPSLLTSYNLIEQWDGYDIISQYTGFFAMLSAEQQETLIHDWQARCYDFTLAPCFKYYIHVFSRPENAVDGESTTYSLDNPKFDHEILSQVKHISVSVSMDTLFHPFYQHANPNQRRTFYQQLQWVISSEHPEWRHLNVSIPFVYSNASIPVLLKSKCVGWTSKLFRRIQRRDQEVTGTPPLESFNDYESYMKGLFVEATEMQLILDSCVQFLMKDYHLKREIRVHQALLHTSHNNKTQQMTAYNQQRHGYYQLNDSEPFRKRVNSNHCYEPIWCDHTDEFQRRIKAWQFPDDPASHFGSRQDDRGIHSTRSCASSKFLLYDPMSFSHGIGSLISQIAHVFRYAMCLNRILVLLPNNNEGSLLKWRFPGCRGNFFECYFQSIHGCSSVVTEKDIANAFNSSDTNNKFLEEYPVKTNRFIRFTGLPLHGKCVLCDGKWDGNIDVFDGLVVNQHTYIPFGSFDTRTADMIHFTSFLSNIKITWIPQFIRYLMQPKSWFAELIREIAMQGLIGPAGEPVDKIPLPFASVHIRYGMKNVEEPPQQLSKYMEALQFKHPFIKNVFISTETESTIHNLRLNYPDINFFHLNYPRVEFLLLSQTSSDQQDFVGEFLYSMANLFVSIEADAFIGTLTSNWCALIHHLERTRGDGGFEYFSMDRGSAYSVCF